MSKHEPEEELRWTKKKRGAHRPQSKGTDGYDRDLWQGDGNNETQGPTESRSAEDVLAKLRAAKEETERLQAEQAAAKRRVAELEAQQAANEPDPVDAEPSAGGQLLETVIRAVVEAAAEAVEEILSTAEGRQALAETGRRAWRSTVIWGRKVLGLGRKTTATAELNAQPSADETSPRLSIVPATEDSVHDEPARTTMSRADYREHLLLYMALKEATARMGEQLQDVDVDGADLPPELESKIQAAMTGQVTELSPEDRELLVGFMIPPDSADSYQIADASDPAQLADENPGPPERDH